ncbi:MAG TPA: prolyl oligopeptidase family serine peptidase [Spirochaetota bacterium]|nr:prolyl oligopeptidase family serine peptidase [Spirochaetota bacterium]HOR45966.1 prolyl oligopeptidase family serine peptidase [Spirochaetota bacterium]HOU84053.1 prolyl oligopeptidase family serine peptidase [Spirochaetota bacterium]HPK57635.1 prolyl oligopeptidase family serine peptidase [Spirochaetota bacterium]HQE58355.1 prolyl oligopeptidase family serine peptidase [Spirochaetota bacterium]
MKKTIILFSLIFFSCSNESDDNDSVNYIGLSYGSETNQKMDLYLPAGRNSETPLLIIVHGGGWAGGDKSEGGDWPKGISQRNMAVANVNYRLIDGVSVTWRDQIEDIDLIVDFLQSKSDDFEYSSKKIIMMGQSAGGHLSLLYSHKYDTAGRIKAVISLAGPTDLTSSELKTYLTAKGILLSQVFTDATQENDASPAKNYRNLPTLFLHGKVDDVVPYSQSKDMYTAMNASGFFCSLVLFDDTGHSVVSNDSNPSVNRFNEVNTAILDWIKKYSK